MAYRRLRVAYQITDVRRQVEGMWRSALTSGYPKLLRGGRGDAVTGIGSRIAGHTRNPVGSGSCDGHNLKRRVAPGQLFEDRLTVILGERAQ
ncbi:MAG: hypothetical protein M0005_06040 [Actinomycetota bacterium]|jgi:hypothetical protein|nr:hypothetical protein [Actinomycetota bacterium]